MKLSVSLKKIKVGSEGFEIEEPKLELEYEPTELVEITTEVIKSLATAFEVVAPILKEM